MRVGIWVVIFTVFIGGCASTDVTPARIEQVARTVDYGDSNAQTLLNKAWRALKKKDFPAALAFTQRCFEFYGEEGKAMNAELSTYEPEVTASSKWALNDVGTCMFIMGEAYIQLEMYSEASRTYKILAEDYTYAQSWDPKGWFWKPAADAALKARKYRNW